MKKLKPFNKKIIVEMLKEEQRTIENALNKAENSSGDVGFMMEVFSLIKAVKQLSNYVSNIEFENDEKS